MAVTGHLELFSFILMWMITLYLHVNLIMHGWIQKRERHGDPLSPSPWKN